MRGRAPVRAPEVAALAAAAVLLPLAAWGALGPRYGGALRIGVLDLPAAPSPAFVRGVGSRLLLGLRHETLVRVGPNGAPRRSLAVCWSASAEGREWTVDLDPQAVFHDGRPVTADDVVRSLRRFLRSDSPAAARLAARLDGGAEFRGARSEAAGGLSSAGPTTLVVRLLAPSTDLPIELASPAAAVTGPDGAACGPFVLVHAVRDERAALGPFLRHVAGRPFLDEIEILRFGDHEALRLALAKGSIDVALGEPGAPTRRARLLLVLDATRPAFREVAARQRVAAAIDRRVLAERFLEGGRPLCRLWWERGRVPDCEPAILAAPPPPTGPRAPLRLAVDQAAPASASRRVVAHLMALGYDVEVRVLTTDAAATATDVDARLLLWVPEIDLPAEAVREVALLPGVPGPVRESVRDATAAGGQGAEAGERALLDSASVIPLAAAPVFAVRDSRIQGVEEDATGRLLLEDAWLAL